MDHKVISKAVLANVFGVSRAAITKSCKDTPVEDFAKLRILRYFTEGKEGKQITDMREAKTRLENAFKKEYRKRCGAQKRVQGRPMEAYNIQDALNMIDEVYTTIQKNIVK